MVARWLRMRVFRRPLYDLYAERARLAQAIRKHGDPFNPTVGEQHTRGMYDGINHAISLVETEYK